MGEFIKVAAKSEISTATSKLIEVAGKKIAVFNVDGTFYAIEDTCTHRGGPLSEGEVEGDAVTCPWHGATFNMKTGEVTGGPAPASVTCYKIRVEGDDVEIEV